MTRINPQELVQVVCPGDQQVAACFIAVWGGEGLMMIAAFLAGLLLGRISKSLY